MCVCGGGGLVVVGCLLCVCVFVVTIVLLIIHTVVIDDVYVYLNQKNVEQMYILHQFCFSICIC